MTAMSRGYSNEEAEERLQRAREEREREEREARESRERVKRTLGRAAAGEGNPPPPS